MPLSTARFSFQGAPSAVFPARGQQGADEGPLLVREVTGMRHRKKGHLARMPFVRHAASDPSVATTAFVATLRPVLGMDSPALLIVADAMAGSTVRAPRG